MNYIRVTIKEVRDNLSELIERTALAKESFLVTKFGKPKALIVSAEMLKKKKSEKEAVLKKTAGLWAQRQNIEKSRKETSSRYEKIFS